MPDDVVIRTEKLSRTFSHGGSQQHVLRNLDLEVERGSFTVIMGPSGAGKSTLLYALSGLDRPSLGRVVVDGVDISRLGEDALARFRRDHCGFVFQQVHLLDQLSVIDNLMAVGLLVERSRARVRERCDRLLDLVGLPEADRGKYPAMLSGGEAQRVGIARALVGRPAAVFADEPTGQLNSRYSGMILDLLGRVHAEGQTIVMVTHDLRSALRGSRILYLRDGRIRGELDLGERRGPGGGRVGGGGDDPDGAVDPDGADAPAAPDDAARTTALTAFLAEMGW